MKYALFYIILSFALGTDFANIVRVDKTVHDWGDVTVNDKNLTCTFTIENISKEVQSIRNVKKTCGCTKVTWTTTPFAPGEKARIDITYTNEDGPYPFDKTVSVYFEGHKKPLNLHIRGDVHKEALPLEQTYPIHYGRIGLKKDVVKVGNLSQGEVASTEVTVANWSDKPLTLSWIDSTAELHIEPAHQTIEAGKTARVVVTVRSNRSKWGKNLYVSTPVIDGKKSGKCVTFTAITKENFSSWSVGMLKDAPVSKTRDVLLPSPVQNGERSEAEFEVENIGKTPLTIYKTEFDSDKLDLLKSASEIRPGDKAAFRFSVRTDSFQKDSDNTCVVTLYTNDPSHPLIHLYIEIIIL